jgi:hypothetical protein
VAAAKAEVVEAAEARTLVAVEGQEVVAEAEEDKTVCVRRNK